MDCLASPSRLLVWEDVLLPRIRSRSPRPPTIRRRSRVEDRGARQILCPPCPFSHRIVHLKRAILPAIKVQDAYKRPTLKVYKMGDPEKEEEGKNKNAGTTPPEKVKELGFDQICMSLLTS